MDYKNIYYRLIEYRKNNIPTGYTEKHHILPKCIGGRRTKENMVALTAREHFIAHRLLFKFTTGKTKVKMGYALHRMCFINNSTQQTRIKFARKFEKLKIYNYVSGSNHPNFGLKMSEEFRQTASESKKGNKNPRFSKRPWNYGLTKLTCEKLKVTDECKAKMSAIMTGRSLSPEGRSKVSNAQKGRIKSESHKQKISNSLRGRKRSPEEVNAMSESRKGVPQKTLTCPFCKKEGGTTMYRWHFDKCKFK